MKSAGKSQADAVVLATFTPDQRLPATAPDVADRLGLCGVPAFDISAMCSGFLYGMATCAGLIATGVANRVLFVAAEVYSAIVDPQDRGTAVIFGDGAGAVVLQAGTAEEPGALGPVILGSDGRFHHLIQVPAGGSRQRRQPGDEFLKMAGREVFRHAVIRMAAASRQAVTDAGWTMSSVDRLATHQANARLLTAVGDDLDIPTKHRLSNIERVGNTAAASIPLVLAHAVADGHLEPGHRVLLTAFGGGLTWGATTLTWPRLRTE